MLFSSTSNDFERKLKEELFSCFKYIGIPFDTLNRMPVRDRKFYIAQHNKAMEEEKEAYEKASKGGSSSSNMNIDRFTDLSQGRRG